MGSERCLTTSGASTRATSKCRPAAPSAPPRHRARVQRVRHRRTRARVTAGDAGPAGRPAIPPTRGFYDECLKGDGVQFSLGFMKPSAVWPFGGAARSGHLEPAVRSASPIRARHRVRLRDEPDGDDPDRRSARRRAQRRARPGARQVTLKFSATRNRTTICRL